MRGRSIGKKHLFGKPRLSCLTDSKIPERGDFDAAIEQAQADYAAFVNQCGGRVIIASQHPLELNVPEHSTMNWNGVRFALVDMPIREASIDEFLACPWPGRPQEGRDYSQFPYFYELSMD